MSKQFPLHALFQALHKSVIQATKVARETSLESLKKDYFTQVHAEDGSPTGVWKPKTITMVLPSPEGQEIKDVSYDVPLYSLVKHQAVALETLKIDFEVELHGLEQLQSEDGGDENMLASTPAGVFSRKTMARVEVTFRGEDPSEGMMRINDKILKTFPA